jgi:hypothetical protein
MTLLAPFFRKRPVSDQPVEGLPILRAANGPRISPLAVVDAKARIGDDCEIGPFCVVPSSPGIPRSVATTCFTPIA